MLRHAERKKTKDDEVLLRQMTGRKVADSESGM